MSAVYRVWLGPTGMVGPMGMFVVVYRTLVGSGGNLAAICQACNSSGCMFAVIYRVWLGLVGMFVAIYRV